jgi:hypothetical protein
LESRLPLPFPACPVCRQSWVRSYHRGCTGAGEFLVAPSSRQAICEGCDRAWSLDQVRFHCACGHEFGPNDVAAALSMAGLVKARLIENMRGMDLAENRIRSRRRESFSQWLYEIAESVGYAAGSIVGTINRWLDAIFRGPDS